MAEPITKLSAKSRMGEILDHPVGHDLMYRLILQIGKNPRLLYNPLLRRIRFGTFAKLAGGALDQAFADSFFDLLNSERARPLTLSGDPEPAWWKEAVIYQIYPCSFRDSNGDGIGDLNGIIERLDCLRELGVDAVWLSPIYCSPNDDNGYDISDYREIQTDFGTMADFDRLLAELKRRGMRLILDMVLNHTSDEHEWFREALSDPSSPKRDYYFLREGSPARTPNNWTSFFSGSAWRYFAREKLWGLHLFSAKQMDLNWQSPELREELKDMLRWWLAKGVDGFRLDVINYISKPDHLPDGNATIGDMMGFYGIEHYVYGQNLHDYLRELTRDVFTPYHAFTVGECPGIGREMNKLLAGEERAELDLVFSFDHLENPGRVRFDEYRYDLDYYKQYMINEQRALGKNHWLSLFFENHDNPRMVSKVNPDPEMRACLAKLLALLLFGMRGTVFLYQGQELGLTNERFDSLDQFRDVESLNHYRRLASEGREAEAWQQLQAGSRDHARTPYPWDDSEYAGFGTAEPWIRGGPANQKLNLASQKSDPDSVWNFYRRLIQIRRLNPGLIYGNVRFVKRKKRHYWACYREYKGKRYLIEANLGEKPMKRALGQPKGRILIANYTNQMNILRPYEGRIIELTKG